MLLYLFLIQTCPGGSSVLLYPLLSNNKMSNFRIVQGINVLEGAGCSPSENQVSVQAEKSSIRALKASKNAADCTIPGNCTLTAGCRQTKELAGKDCIGDCRR